MSCLTQLPASIRDSDCTETLQALGVVLVVGFFILKRFYRKWTEKHSYAVYFGEGDDLVNVGADCKTVEIGEHVLDVMIRAKRTVEVESANLRFTVDTKQAQNPRSDVEKSVIAIVDAKDLDIRAPQFSSKHGKAGGYDLTYSPAYRRVSGEFLHIRIRVKVKQEWEGYLRFCESKAYYYHPFRVVKKTTITS
ncbi:MAG: hypothetical protein ACRD5H_13900, partial [Nitrososphaerales archaeon]